MERRQPYNYKFKIRYGNILNRRTFFRLHTFIKNKKEEGLRYYIENVSRTLVLLDSSL